MTYKPEKSVGNFLWCLWPFIIVPAAYIFYDKYPTIVMIIYCISVLGGVYLTLSTISVMFGELYMDNEKISRKSPFGKMVVYWEDIIDTKIHQRENAISRNDSLVLIRSNKGLCAINPSAFSKSDEIAIINTIKQKTKCTIKKSSPSI